jgi:hypothetical protein
MSASTGTSVLGDDESSSRDNALRVGLVLPAPRLPQGASSARAAGMFSSVLFHSAAVAAVLVASAWSGSTASSALSPPMTRTREPLQLPRMGATVSRGLLPAHGPSVKIV